MNFEDLQIVDKGNLGSRYHQFRFSSECQLDSHYQCLVGHNKSNETLSVTYY